MLERPRTRRLAGLFGLCSLGLGLGLTARGDAPWPEENAWPEAAPAEVGLDADRLAEAKAYALTGGGSGILVRGGRKVLEWGDPDRRYDLKSTSKSIGVSALGLAIADGVIDLEDRVVAHLPSLGTPPVSNARTGWLPEITIRQLANQSAGFEKPGGFEPLLFEPGTRWHYSDGGPNWLADGVTTVYGRDIESLLFDRVFERLGITRSDLRWREHAYRPRTLDGVRRLEFGSGVHANVDAMARIGLLYLRQGRWRGQQLLPSAFVDQVRVPDPQLAGLPEHDPEAHGNASKHYGLLWWNNADGTLPDVPRDAYWSWGLHDSLILVIPSLDLVAARAGQGWDRASDGGHYDVLKPFFGPIAASALTAAPHPDAPYPPSEAILGVSWVPADQIVRKAEGSDNWPLTWADDDALYTAYGDGWGFEPRVPEKLSLGLAKVVGPPDDFEGLNIRSPSIEQRGNGPSGKKASGLLMVNGTLYLWARNAGNAQLAWSSDRGATWTWADWRFETSFGCPTFLNFGRNDEGSRDEYVYVYSQDVDSAYEPADAMVLARVPKDRIRDRAAYRVFAGRNAQGEPRWTNRIEDRAPVFEHPGRCYRSSVSHHPGLNRYLWCQTIPGEDTRFEGGFAIYDAPEPWGPWTTVFFTERWDVGPGETQHLPTKWMSPDGRSVHLVFSGDDHFSVRRAELIPARR